MHPNISIQTAYLSKDQKNLVLCLNPSDLLKYTAASAKEQKWSEKVKDYIVNSDGNIANVWTPMTFMPMINLAIVEPFFSLRFIPMKVGKS